MENTATPSPSAQEQIPREISSNNAVASNGIFSPSGGQPNAGAIVHERHTAETPPKTEKNPKKVAAGKASAQKTNQARQLQKEKAKNWDDYQASLVKNSGVSAQSPVIDETTKKSPGGQSWMPSFNQVIAIASLGVSAGFIHFKFIRPRLQATKFSPRPEKRLSQRASGPGPEPQKLSTFGRTNKAPEKICPPDGENFVPSTRQSPRNFPANTKTKKFFEME